MSGRKQATVTIYRSEYERLLEAERRLHQSQRVLPEVEQAIRSVRQEMARALEQVDQRGQKFQRALQDIHGDIQRLEMGTASRLQEQQRQMKEAIRDIRREMHVLLEEQERRFNEMLAQERRAREHQIAQIQNQINALVVDAQRKREVARAWIESTQILWNFIKENYHHQFFQPGALERLERILRQAQENLNQGIPEAALAQAQQAYYLL